MHKTKSTLENETNEIFQDFEIQTNHLIRPVENQILSLLSNKNQTCLKTTS